MEELFLKESVVISDAMFEVLMKALQKEDDAENGNYWKNTAKSTIDEFLSSLGDKMILRVRTKNAMRKHGYVVHRMLPLRGGRQATECSAFGNLRLKHDCNFEIESVCFLSKYNAKERYV